MKLILYLFFQRHSKKFFIDKGPRQIENLPPGSVIDTQIVRSDLTEFYLQPHVPLKVFDILKMI